MNTIVKALTGILGVLAVAACLATIGIIGYTIAGGGGSRQTSSTQHNNQENRGEEVEPPTALALPASTPDNQGETAESPHPTGQVIDLANHVHDYIPEVVKEATCYEAGQVRYTCECGDYYFVDVMSTGHVADDWETVKTPTATEEGRRVRKCIYCDEIVAQETIPLETTSGANGTAATAAHSHEYTASIEREPTCTLAGLRKYTCSCGAFYTEPIPADGHVASDWTVAEAATSTQMGTEQRVCNVCGVLLDSRPIAVTSASPSASTATSNASASTAASASASSTARASASTSASATTSPTATPTATPHAHNYVSYVLKQPNCTERGIRSFVCSCGSSYAESIDKDLNSHTFRSMRIPATVSTQGYTTYTCIRCNYSYVDNYVPATGTN